MKRILCIISEILTVLFFLFWVAMFFAVRYIEWFKPINIIMLSNVVILIAMVIIGATYLDMSIDKFYSWYSTDKLPFKENIIIGIELYILIAFLITFGSIILIHNIQGIDLVDFEDMQLKCLGLILANSWLWYGAYQAYHVVIKK